MVKLTIARSDNIYKCFPDIALTPDGTLVCLYRECMMHAPFPFSRIAIQRSLDGGHNWLEKEILVECVPTEEHLDACRAWLEPDGIAGYEESKARIEEDWQIGASINCPRLICLADGTLLLIGDLSLPPDDSGSTRVLDKAWRSTDSGATWSDGEDMALAHQGYQPALTQLRDGTILLGLDVPGKGPAVCFSADGGRTWGDSIFIPISSERSAAEVSYVELDDGTLVGWGRDITAEQKQMPHAAIKVISRDGGQTWEGPYDTWLLGCEGRPRAGLLSSGEVCVTYRCDLPNEMLALHVMTQEAAQMERTQDTVRLPQMPEDLATKAREAKGQIDVPWYAQHYPGRTIILDIDRSVHRDGGYSGWVQLPSGEIFVVDYINDDAPLAQIRGYLVSRSDYLLFPEGDMASIGPSWQPFRSMTAGMARRQFAQNRSKRAAS